MKGLSPFTLPPTPFSLAQPKQLTQSPPFLPDNFEYIDSYIVLLILALLVKIFVLENQKDQKPNTVHMKELFTCLVVFGPRNFIEK